MLKEIISKFLLRRSEMVIMDVDVVVEHSTGALRNPLTALSSWWSRGQRSLQTVRNIKALASDLGMARCLVVVSKISDAAGRQFIIDNMPDFEILGFISYDTTVADADIQGVGVYDAAPAAAAEGRKTKVVLESVIGK